MKKIVKIFLFFLLSILLVNTVELNAESTLYNDFKNNVSASSTKHITYQTNECRDLHFMNAYIEGYMIICEKDNKTYLNLLLINKSTGVEIELLFKVSSKEYIKRTYDVNGTTTVYGLDLSSYSEFSVSTTQNNVLISVLDYNVSDLNQHLLTSGIVTNGTAAFPENIIHEPAKNKIVNLIIVCGIILSAFLGIIIFVIVKTKKVNIKREEPVFKFLFKEQKEDKKITNEDILDVEYEEKDEKTSPEVLSLNDPKYLTELYRKKLNNEITDQEFEVALRRYQNSKDLEDDND